MTKSFSDPPMNEDLLREMRLLAKDGTSVRALTQLIQLRLDVTYENGAIAILAYFCRAFLIPLREVLPIREWLGTTQDAEIDAQILPLIEQNKDEWKPMIERMESLLS